MDAIAREFTVSSASTRGR
ncbi:hypothetical protein YPPY01_4654, partial [Yersinia pestis PY-01]